MAEVNVGSASVIIFPTMKDFGPQVAKALKPVLSQIQKTIKDGLNDIPSETQKATKKAGDKSTPEGKRAGKKIGDGLSKEMRNTVLSGAQRLSTDIGSIFRKLATVGIVYYLGKQWATQITTGLHSVLSASNDLAQSQSALEQVFGPAADKVIEWAQSSAKAFGIAKDEVYSYSSILGIFGSQAGKAGDDLSSFTTSLLERAADMAAFANTTTADALQSIQAVMRGEFNPIEKYGLLLNQTKINAEALAAGLWDGKEAISTTARIQAAYNLIMRGSAIYAGQAAKEADSYSARLAQINAQWRDLRASLGDRLMPLASKFLGLFSGKGFEAITIITTKLADFIGQKLQPLVESGVIEQWFDKMLAWANRFDPQKMWGNIKEFAGYFQNIFDGFKNVISSEPVQKVLGLIKDTFSSPEGVANFVKMAAGLWALSKAIPMITGLISLVSSLVGGLKTFGAWFGSIFTKAGGALGASSGIGKLLTSFGTNFMKFLGPIGLIASVLIAVITQIASLPGFIEKASASFQGFVGQAWELIKEIFEGATKAVQPIITLIVDIIGQFLKGLTGQKSETEAFLAALKGTLNVILAVLYGVKLLVNFIGLGLTVVGAAIASLLNLGMIAQNAVIDSLNPVLSALGLNQLARQSLIQPPDVGAFYAGLDWSPPTFLATGADILPRPGGTLAVLGEAGEAETVVNRGQMNATLKAVERRLNRSGSEEKPVVINVYPSAGMNEVELARKVQRLNWQNQKRFATP